MRWTSDTHDNENEGKRSSKSCCIYHRKRAWDESSSESDADPKDNSSDGSDSSSSSGGPLATRRRIPANAIVEDSGVVEQSEPVNNASPGTPDEREHAEADKPEETR